MIIATKESFVGSFTYYLNGYITEPGHELPFSDQKTYNQPILQARDFNRLRRGSHEAGINAGSGCTDSSYCLITQFILYGHPVFPNLTLIPQPLKEQPYRGCQEYRLIRARTYTYQVSGYITDQLSNPDCPQSFTELIPFDTPLLSGKGFSQMTQYLRNHLLGDDPRHLLVTEFNLIHDPVYILNDWFLTHSVSRGSDGLLWDRGICVASS
ncbi:hypothetical protein ACV1DN_20865 [Aeromonas allosaccharophila]